MNKPLYAKYKKDRTNWERLAIIVNLTISVGKKVLSIMARGSTVPKPRPKIVETLVDVLSPICMTPRISRRITINRVHANLFDCQTIAIGDVENLTKRKSLFAVSCLWHLAIANVGRPR